MHNSYIEANRICLYQFLQHRKIFQKWIEPSDERPTNVEKKVNAVGLEVIIALTFPTANLDPKSKWEYKGNYFQPTILYPAKLLIKNEDKDIFKHINIDKIYLLGHHSLENSWRME